MTFLLGAELSAVLGPWEALRCRLSPGQGSRRLWTVWSAQMVAAGLGAEHGVPCTGTGFPFIRCD